jgi:aspartyl-tRNA(Asn)/glutamyl-tRNA(Gln) amidotransferase subunit A
VQPALRQIAEQGAALQAADYVEALNLVTALRASFVQVFARWDLILTPCFAAPAWPAEVTHPETINGQSVGPRGHAVFTAFANVGGLPGISLPCRPSRDGLPIGFQLVGAHGADMLLLSLGAQFEQAHPWAHRWPALGKGALS